MPNIYTEYVTNYIRSEDITIVWQFLYVEDEIIQRTLVGWYHGESDDESTKAFSHLGVMAQYIYD